MDFDAGALRGSTNAQMSGSALNAVAVRVLAEGAAVLILSWIVAGSACGQTQAADNCKLRASPPPMATFGGPAVAGRGNTELGLAVGVYGEGFDAPCAIDMGGATNWFVRWRRGIGDRSDLGFDVATFDQSDGSFGATTKVAGRYAATRGLRLEGGVGTSDNGDGRSVNGDVAAVIGTNKHPERTWNYYASLRLAATHGCFNLLCIGGEGTPGSRPPGAVFPLGVIGATARASDATSFVMEGGLGEWVSRRTPSTGLYIHLNFGVLFDVGKYRKH